MNNIILGRKVAKLRKQKEMSTTELAKKAGLSQPQVSRLENGKQGFRSATLTRISKALEVSPAYFFDEGEASESAKKTLAKRSELGGQVINDLTLQFGEIVVTPGYRQTIKKLANSLSKRDCEHKVLRRLIDKIISMNNEERIKILNSLNGK